MGVHEGVGGRVCVWLRLGKTHQDVGVVGV